MITLKWDQFPLVRPLLAFATGLCIEHASTIDIRIPLVLSIVLTLGLLVIHRGILGAVLNRGFFIVALFGVCGWLYGQLRQDTVYEKKQDEKSCILTIESNPFIRERTVKCIARVEALRTTTSWIVRPQRVVVYIQRDSASRGLHYGDKIYVHDFPREVDKPRNPGEFDYRSWLHNHHITGQIFVRKSNWRFVSAENGRRSMATAIHLRLWCEQQLHELGLRDDQLAVVQALLLGDDDQMDPALTRAYSISGTLHVLSVSGMHVALLFLVLSWLLKPIRRLLKGIWIQALLMVLALWFYALLTGASPPVLRAVLMLSVVRIGQLFARQAHILNLLAAAAFILLLIDPYLLMDIGFQLSFIAVAGIVVLQPAVEDWWKPKWRLAKWTWSLISVTLVAQLVTFPLGLYYFGQFPTYFLFSNLIVIPLSTLIMYGGLILLLVAPFHFLAQWLVIPVAYLLDMMNWLVRATDLLPGAVISTTTWSIFQLGIWYVFVTALGYVLLTRRISALQISLTCLIVLLLSCWPEHYYRQHAQELLVYSISGTTAVEFRKGDAHILFMDSSGIKNSKLLSYHIQPGWRKEGLKDIEPLVFSDSLQLRNSLVAVSGNWFQAGQTLVYSTSPNSTGSIQQMPCTVLLVNGYTNDSPDHFLKQLQPKYVVINGSCPQREAIRWKTICAKQNLKCINVKETGFWRLDLNHLNM
jgi:competence protein ComEC